MLTFLKVFLKTCKSTSNLYLQHSLTGGVQLLFSNLLVFSRSATGPHSSCPSFCRPPACWNCCFAVKTVLDQCRCSEQRQSLNTTKSPPTPHHRKTLHIWSLALALILSGQAVTPECLQNTFFVFTLIFFLLFFIPQKPQHSQWSQELLRERDTEVKTLECCWCWWSWNMNCWSEIFWAGWIPRTDNELWSNTYKKREKKNTSAGFSPCFCFREISNQNCFAQKITISFSNTLFHHASVMWCNSAPGRGRTLTHSSSLYPNMRRAHVRVWTVWGWLGTGEGPTPFLPRPLLDARAVRGGSWCFAGAAQRGLDLLQRGTQSGTCCSLEHSPLVLHTGVGSWTAELVLDGLCGRDRETQVGLGHGNTPMEKHPLRPAWANLSSSEPVQKQNFSTWPPLHIYLFV